MLLLIVLCLKPGLTVKPVTVEHHALNKLNMIHKNEVSEE